MRARLMWLRGIFDKFKLVDVIIILIIGESSSSTHRIRWSGVRGFTLASPFMSDAPQRFAYVHFFLAVHGLETVDASVCF